MNDFGLEKELEKALRVRVPTLWLNPNWQSAQRALPALPLNYTSIQEAAVRWSRLAGVLRHCFEELASSGGVIESPVFAVPRLQQELAVDRQLFESGSPQ